MYRSAVVNTIPGQTSVLRSIPLTPKASGQFLLTTVFSSDQKVRVMKVLDDFQKMYCEKVSGKIISGNFFFLMYLLILLIVS